MEKRPEKNPKPLQFDVIILYSGQTVMSAGDKNYKGRAPFTAKGGYASLNKSYMYFLQYCKQQGLRAAFATTKDIVGPGLLKSVWIYEKNWKRLKTLSYSSLIFDKFPTIVNYKRNKLLMGTAGKIRLFHNPDIRRVFDNKLKTFNAFSEYTLPTVSIDLFSKKEITLAKKKLHGQMKRHKYAKDFTAAFVVKDQCGSGGNDVFKRSEKTLAASSITQDIEKEFILQPFINASGFHFGKQNGITDLRVIVSNGDIIQSYLRTAKKGEFRANAQQGGTVKYLTKSMLPPEVITMSAAINKKLPTQDTVYALDFIKSSSGHLYFIEGNSTPGLGWFDAEDEKKSKQLIRVMVKHIQNILHPNA